MSLVDERERRFRWNRCTRRGCRWRYMVDTWISISVQSCDVWRIGTGSKDRNSIFRGYQGAGIPQEESIPPLRCTRCIKSFLGRFRHRKLALSFFFPSFLHTRISTVRLLRARDGLVPRYCITAMRGIYETKPSKIPTLEFLCVVQT